MRILLANEARAGAGGVETYLSAVAGALAGRGHDVALLYGNSSAETGPTTIRAAQSWSVADENLRGALEHVQAWRPEVAYSHNMRRLDVDAALLADWPVVKMMHGYFGTCVSGQKMFLLPSAQACTRRCGPACLALYGPRRCGRLRPLEVVRNYRWAERQRDLFGRYRAIVVASHHMRDEYLAHGVEPGRVHAIPLFAAAGSPASSNGSAIDVLFLGRITTLKGTRPLARALNVAGAALRRRLSVVIAGEGPAKAALQSALANGPWLSAEFPGWVGDSARADLLARSRIVVIPSVWPEPFGLVGLEAAAAGVPAVAFDVGGIRDWLTDGVNGKLVTPPGDGVALGTAIADVLRDPEGRARLASGARAVARRFSPDAHVSRVERILEAACRS